MPHASLASLVPPVFALSDAVVIQIVTGLITLIGTIFTGAMAYLMARLNAQQDRRSREQAARSDEVKRALDENTELTASLGREQVALSQDASRKAEEVKRSLAATARASDAKADEVRRALAATSESGARKLDDLAKVAKATHTLVNSNMRIQLYNNMMLARRLAEITRLPADVAAASTAEDLYDEHVARQKAVDAQEGTDAQKSGNGGAAAAAPPGEKLS